MAQFDVIILGGGPAGYVCAIRAAQLGLTTAVVEKDKLGGVCVNIGCIPTKALLHSAWVASIVSHDAKELGIETGPIKTDYGVAMKRSRKVADQNSKGVEFLMKKNKVTVIKGQGVLQPGRKVKVGADVHTAGKKAVVIATGSRVKGIPQIGLEINKTTVISSDEALFLEQAPKTLAVIGAGAVGSEFADIFSAFGTKVTLIEALPRILPIEDAESSDVVAKSFRKRGITVVAGAKVTKADVRKDGVTLTVEAGGKTETVEVEKVLMAAGRAVNTEDIGLKECGIQLTDRGFIKADLRTLRDDGTRVLLSSATWPARRCWRTREAARASTWRRRLPGCSRTRSATTTYRASPTVIPRLRASGSPKNSARRRSSTTRSGASRSARTAAPGRRTRPRDS